MTMDHESQTDRRKEILIVLSICIVALCIRLSFLSSWAATPLFHSLLGDEQNFHNTALSLLGQRPSTGPFLYQPLYSFFLASVYWLFGESASLVRMIQLLLGVLGVYFAFLVGKTIGGVLVGCVNAILIALYGPLVFFEGHLLAPGLVVFLLNGAFLFLLASEKPKSYCMLFPAGLFMGLAMMGRPNLVVILPVALVWLLVRKLSWKRRVAGIGLATVGLMVGMGPSVIYNAMHGGGLVPVSTAGGISFFIGNNPQATGRYHVPKHQGIDASSHEAYSRSLAQVAQQAQGYTLSQSQVSAYWYGRGLNFWLTAPGKAIWLFGKKLLMSFGSQEQPIHNPYELGCELAPVLRLLLTFGVIFPFFVLSLFWSIRTLKAGWMFALFVLAYAVSMAVFYVSDRYRLAMLPMMTPLAAAGMVELGRRFGRGGLKTVWVGLVIIAISFGVSQATRASDDELARIMSAGYNRLGTAAATMGRLDEARHAFSHAISIAGPKAGMGLRMNLGMTYFKMGDFRRAAKYFEDLVDMAPGDVRPVIRRAQLAEYMEDIPGAIRWWKKAARLMDEPGLALEHIQKLTVLNKKNSREND